MQWRWGWMVWWIWIWLIWSYPIQFLHEWFERIPIMVKQFLCTIEMNGLCKLNQVVNPGIMRMKMGCIKWNGSYQKY